MRLDSGGGFMGGFYDTLMAAKDQQMREALALAQQHMAESQQQWEMSPNNPINLMRTQQAAASRDQAAREKEEAEYAKGRRPFLEQVAQQNLELTKSQKDAYVESQHAQAALRKAQEMAAQQSAVSGGVNSLKTLLGQGLTYGAALPASGLPDSVVQAMTQARINQEDARRQATLLPKLMEQETAKETGRRQEAALPGIVQAGTQQMGMNLPQAAAGGPMGVMGAMLQFPQSIQQGMAAVPAPTAAEVRPAAIAQIPAATAADVLNQQGEDYLADAKARQAKIDNETIRAGAAADAVQVRADHERFLREQLKIRQPEIMARAKLALARIDNLKQQPQLREKYLGILDSHYKRMDSRAAIAKPDQQRRWSAQNAHAMRGDLLEVRGTVRKIKDDADATDLRIAQVDAELQSLQADPNWAQSTLADMKTGLTPAARVNQLLAQRGKLIERRDDLKGSMQSYQGLEQDITEDLRTNSLVRTTGPAGRAPAGGSKPAAGGGTSQQTHMNAVRQYLFGSK